MPQAKKTAAGRRPDPCRARWRHLPAAPKVEGRPSCIIHSSTCRSTHCRRSCLCVPLHRRSPLRCKAWRRSRSLSHVTARAGRSLRPTCAEVAPASPRRPQIRPHACRHRPSAGQVCSGPAAKPGLGKTWTIARSICRRNFLLKIIGHVVARSPPIDSRPCQEKPLTSRGFGEAVYICAVRWLGRSVAISNCSEIILSGDEHRPPV